MDPNYSLPRSRDLIVITEYFVGNITFSYVMITDLYVICCILFMEVLEM